ncbi:MAG: hypothetical protein LAN63_01490 [Acidobacteriia bacterium]|nr:hypothetical protein [Terriglobia bacterium]
MGATGDQFWAKKTALDEITKRVKVQMKRLATANEALNGVVYVAAGSGWQWTRIEGLGQYPSYLAKADRMVAQWPTADEVAALLTAWHQADQAYRIAWDQMTQTEKEQMLIHRPSERNAPDPLKRA